MKAKVFMTGRSQAVRLPLEFRFDTTEVYVRRNAAGEVVLSTKPEKKPWKEIFARLDAAGVPRDFLQDRDKRRAEERDLF
jgi:antitoxin VapB